jgi:hypothetical protein
LNLLWFKLSTCGIPFTWPKTNFLDRGHECIIYMV